MEETTRKHVRNKADNNQEEIPISDNGEGLTKALCGMNHVKINVQASCQLKLGNTSSPHGVNKYITVTFNSSPPGQNGRDFTDDIFNCIFVNEKFCILIKITLKFVQH